MDNLIIPVVAFLIGAVLFFFVGNTYRAKQNREKIGSAKTLAEKILDDANRDAETAKKEADSIDVESASLCHGSN